MNVKNYYEKDKGIIQGSFDILIGGKVKNISFHSTDKPFFKYKNMVHYVAKKEYVSRYGKKWDDYEIYQIERDILLKIIRISWNIFTENERKNFYLVFAIINIYISLNLIWCLRPTG